MSLKESGLKILYLPLLVVTGCIQLLEKLQLSNNLRKRSDIQAGSVKKLLKMKQLFCYVQAIIS